VLFTSGHVERILFQLSAAIVSAIGGTDTQRGFIPHVLRDLTKLESRPRYLTEMAYGWCSTICENRRRREDRECILLSLEIGFRHLDPQSRRPTDLGFAYTERHQGLVDVVFESGDGEAIADFLHALTMDGGYSEIVGTLLGACTGYLANLHNLVVFSSRLRRLVIRSVGLMGYEGFYGVGMDRFIELLNHLNVTIEDLDETFLWAKLLLGTLRSESEGVQQLLHQYWELLVELVVSDSQWQEGGVAGAYNPRITASLVDAQEWSRLECWMGTVWILWPPGVGETTEEDLDHLMLLLFRQRPGALQRLGRWMERWSQGCGRDVPGSFQQICERAREAAQHDAP